MRKGLYFITFFAGMAAGAAVTYGCIKNKYEKMAQEEIDSVKEFFVKKNIRNGEKAGEGFREGFKQNTEKAVSGIAEYVDILQKAGYADADEQEERPMEDDGRPYVITPDEFGEFNEYDTISLTYYADGVLANDDDEVIKDAESIVGDALWHFGEYEEDSVFVRCDKLQCDYEILLDKRNFSEVTGAGLDQMEEE